MIVADMILVFRTILGIILVMFIPGFLLSQLIFKKQTPIQMLTMSIALSVFIVILLSFFLTLLSFFSPVRINVLSVFISLSAVVIVFSGALLLRRKNEK